MTCCVRLTVKELVLIKVKKKNCWFQFCLLSTTLARETQSALHLWQSPKVMCKCSLTHPVCERRSVLLPTGKPYGGWTVSSDRWAFSDSSLPCFEWFRSVSKKAQMSVAPVRLSIHAPDIHTWMFWGRSAAISKIVYTKNQETPAEPIELNWVELRWRIFEILLRILHVRKCNVKL